MKWISFLIVFGIGLTAFTGCYTIPRHYVTQEIIVYYPAPPPVPIPPYPGPEPWPDPPSYPHPTNPPAPEQPNQPVDRQPEKPKDSYDRRDPLQGGNHRGNDEIKTYPPVRTPVQKDRGSQ
jgi:hypothetical protein